MKSLQQLVSANAHQVPSQNHAGQGTSALNEEAAKHVNGVFTALQSAFPAWKNAIPTDQALKETKRTWTKALIENGITSIEQVQQGLRQARAEESPFFPSVGQFISWCKPDGADLGLSLETVVAEITERRGRHRGQGFSWSHPVIEQINFRMGFQVYQLSAEKFCLAVKRELEHWLKRLAAGESLPEPMLAIESDQAPSRCYADQVGFKAKSFGARAMQDRIARIQKKAASQ